MATDKISKINKIEGNKKAKAVVKKAQNATSTASKKVSTRAKKVQVAAKKVASKVAKDAKVAVAKGKAFALGSVEISEKKLAKIEAFFKDFIKDAKAKNEFFEAAILKQIKKHKKKCKKRQIEKKATKTN